jgi:hypothetical protein
LRGFSKWALALVDADTDFDLLAFDFGVLAGGDDFDFSGFVSVDLSLADAEFAFTAFDFVAGDGFDFVAACTFDFFVDPVVFVVFSLGCFVLLRGASLLSFAFFFFFLLLTLSGNNRTPITCSTVAIKLCNVLNKAGDFSAMLKQDRIRFRSVGMIRPPSLESTSIDFVAPPRTDRISSRLLVGDAECDEDIIEDDD